MYQYNAKTKTWDKIKTLTATSYKVSNLKAGTTYKYRIKCYKDDAGLIWGKATSDITVATKPAAPTGIKIAQNESAIKLTWNKVAGADGYRVYMYNASTKKYTNLKTLTTTSYMLTGLKAGTNYQFKIIAYKKVEGIVIWGNYTPMITTSTRTVAPKITAVASTAKGRAAVAWTNVAGETGYELWASTKKDTGYKKIVTTKANATKGVRTGLVSGRTYYFKVRAYKTVGNTVVYSALSAPQALKIK